MGARKITNNFHTFSYQIKHTYNGNIMIGVASYELNNDKTNQDMHNDFIGYWGYDNGYVYD